MFRSLLFVPGSSIKMILKAQESPADALVLDLEDGVAPEHKLDARSTVSQIMREIDFTDREVFVRINSLRTEWGLEDVRAVVAGGARGVLIPKIENVDEVTTIAAVLNARLHRSEDRQRPQILCLVETPRGVFAARELAASNELVTGLMFGASDLARALGSQLTDDEPELLMARSQLLLAARAAGIKAYDSADQTVHDPDRLRRRCLATRHLGYDGKAASHPAQLAIINQVFTPTAEQIAAAEEIVAIMGAAIARGRGTAICQGRMIDQVHFDEAQSLLRKVGGAG
jgi:citrate lyase beta subunit